MSKLISIARIIIINKKTEIKIILKYFIKHCKMQYWLWTETELTSTFATTYYDYFKTGFANGCIEHL